MTQIKIEVPANDHIALSAMADALQRIATERAPSVTTGDAAWKQMDKIYAERGGAFENTTTEKEHDENMLADAGKAFEDLQPNANPEHASRFDVELNRLDEELEASIHHDETFDKTVSTLPDYETSIANFHTEPRVRDSVTEQGDTTKHIETFEEGEKLFDAEIARMDEEREQLDTTDSTLDADGVPHDKRIHSKGATRLADNTWRLRKRPADKTEEEWTAYIDSVKAELKAVQDIPSETTPEEFIETVQLNEGVTTDDIVEALTGEPTLDEQAVADLTPPVIEEPVTQLEGVTPNGDVAIEPPVTTVGTPVAPVTPPTSLTPPSVEAPSDQPSVTTFQELMLYITGNAKKRGADNDMIKATLAEVDPALTAIPLIATRADLIPKFVEALEAKLA